MLTMGFFLFLAASNAAVSATADPRHPQQQLLRPPGPRTKEGPPPAPAAAAAAAAAAGSAVAFDM